MNNTEMANLITIGGVSLALGIAGMPLSISLIILGTTVLGCGYLTDRENKK